MVSKVGSAPRGLGFDSRFQQSYIKISQQNPTQVLSWPNVTKFQCSKGFVLVYPTRQGRWQPCSKDDFILADLFTKQFVHIFKKAFQKEVHF